MIGILEETLTRTFGEPRIFSSQALLEFRWNTSEEESCQSVLYKCLDQYHGSPNSLDHFSYLYGDALGGTMVGDSLKVAMLDGPEVFGLYSIDELQFQKEVRLASRLDGKIDFFMDASNMWFYGIKARELYVYDAETHELDMLGPIALALEQLILEWQESS